MNRTPPRAPAALLMASLAGAQEADRPALMRVARWKEDSVPSCARPGADEILIRPAP